MSELFPELDKELVNRILRDGIKLEKEDPAAGLPLSKLAELGIVNAETLNYVRCANREDPDFKDCPDQNCPGLIYLNENTIAYVCPECDRQVYQAKNKQMFTEYEVALDIPGIKKYVRRIFLQLDLVETIIDDKGGAFQITLSDDRPIPLCLLDEAESTNRETLYIQVSPLAKQSDSLHIIELADFLSKPPSTIRVQWSDHLNTLLLTTTEQLELFNLLVDKYNDEEIKELCFKLQTVDYDDLAGEGRRAKIRELIRALERRNQLPELVRLINEERPGTI